MELPLSPAAGRGPREIYTVSRLNREVRALLERGFPMLWIEGEISNLARPGSGHLYFCLKDAQAQIRCALFKSQVRLLGITPREGMRVLVRARVSLYEGRGEFQLLVEHMEDSGEGALRRAFEALKARLATEGLFEAARKKPLPALPKRIGIITSPTGAAVRDILSTLKRRFPAISVLLYPVPVQGQGAAEKIAAMIRLAGRRRECDALILARGGGSLEDLWPFNEEIVARAMAECALPIVSGVGHETDFTIADLVADVRAPTPTAAAELLSGSQEIWLAQFRHYEARLGKLMQRKLTESAQRMDWLSARLVRPEQRIVLIAQRVESLRRRLVLAQSVRLEHATNRLAARSARLRALSPLHRLQALGGRARHARTRLALAIRRGIEQRHAGLERAAQSLNALSPLATLGRGYAIVKKADGETILRQAAAVKPGEKIRAVLAQGKLVCIVERTEDE